MNRRSALRFGGAVLAGLAGCTGSPEPGTPVVESTPTDESTPTRTPIPGPKQSDDLPSDDTPDDGYPPEFSETPPEPEFDIASFESGEYNGVDVPRAPIDVAYYWYTTGEARFADARSRRAYDESHIYGAVSSPEPDGGSDDPIDEWPTDDRIVAYCGCPYSMSSIRAANLIEEGYEEVYVIADGYWDWVDLDFPIAGEEVESQPALRVIEGAANAEFAGETAWARHPATDQREAAAIDDDGRFELHLRFADVTADSTIEVETPGYSVSGSLGELTDGVVDGRA